MHKWFMEMVYMLLLCIDYIVWPVVCPCLTGYLPLFTCYLPLFYRLSALKQMALIPTNCVVATIYFSDPLAELAVIFSLGASIAGSTVITN